MALAIPETVERILAAQDARSTLGLLSADGDLSLDHAYDIQEALRVEMIRRGELPVGWKLAATGPTGQALFGIDEPIYGHLPPQVYASGEPVSVGDFVKLYVEAEFAFRMGADLAGPGVTADSALAAVESVAPALELPDVPFEEAPLVTDAVAMAALSRAIMVGDAHTGLSAEDLIDEEVVLEHNGEVVSTNTGAELMGNPLNGLAWLANQLGSRGLGLRQGDIVMSGAVSALVPAAAGDSFTARYRRLGAVELTVTE